MKIEKEIEHIMLYFTSDIRKQMLELDNILNKVKINEKILNSEQF